VRVLYDTNVLVAAIVQAHAMHSRALPWLRRARADEVDLVVSSHTLAELYAVLTTLPTRPRIVPGTAWRLIHENIESCARVVALSPSDYAAVIKTAAELGLTGGAVYDAIIAKVAEKAGVERLLTFDGDDFRRVWPSGTKIISEP